MKNNNKTINKEALLYHSEGRPGKIEVVPTKPYSTQKDLSLAYSPGVAQPCLEIEKNPEDAYKYTAKGNLVAVISNGTAVLGLGDIGALAGKPVMEGKGLLFKTFADIDVFDIEVDTKDVDKFIDTVKNISPTFGGINLEDIKAPECFEIEKRLKAELSIPVMHDDQHGTAIISSAALINSLEIVGKKIENIKIVVNGAGAAAVACTKLYISLGVNPENIVMCDSKGPITTERHDLNPMKAEFATTRKLTTLAEAVKGADMFLGLSVEGVLSKKMVQSMAKDPIVFALANPNPEIKYADAMAARADIIFATGRSDFPNQVNNVLGFPYIFRGALDVRATKINEEMKIAAAKAIAELARQPIPDIVATAYNNPNISFGREYIIPKPLDPRLITSISIAVAKAAIESGVARKAITNWEAYRIELEQRMGRDNKLLRAIRNKALTSTPCQMVFSEGENINTLKAALSLYNDKIAIPIIVGDKTHIIKVLADNHIELNPDFIVDYMSTEMAAKRERYARLLYDKMNRKGLSLEEARHLMTQREWFALTMVYAGEADSAIATYSRRYTRALEPIRSLFTSNENQILAAMVVALTKRGPIFFSDIAVNPNPTAAELATITKLTANTVSKFGLEPVVAMLSYSNFGTGTEPEATKVADAVRILHAEEPNMIVDGEIKADFALNKKERMKRFPFSKLADHDVNTLVFPDLAAANISYRVIEELGGAEITGPILLGLSTPVHIISNDASMRDIINLATIAATDVVCKGADVCIKKGTH